MSDLNREQVALVAAARWAVAVMEASLVAAVRYADDMGGLQAGDVRLDGGAPADMLGDSLSCGAG